MQHPQEYENIQEGEKAEEKVVEPEPRAQIIANTSEVKSEYCKDHPRKRISKSTNTKYEIYEYQRGQVKRSQSQVNCSSVGSKVIKEKKIESAVKKTEPRKLDPNNSADQREIQARL